MNYALTIRDTHLSVVVSMTEDDGRKMVVTLTGDYHVSRDGGHLVGLVTGLDVAKTGGDPDGDVVRMAKGAAELQTVLADKPFAVSFRVYDGALMVGNVRMPACDDDLVGLFAAMGGRYAAGEKAPPKPVKVGGVPASRPAATPSPNARGSVRVNTAEPTARMQQLLYQSEDLRQVGNEWRRFWFNDQPSHLTPERIHGGIY
jgi:hypothetical protein